MPIKVVHIDQNGFYIGDVLIEAGQEVPSDCIVTPCPNGFYLPKWNGIQWVEGKTQAEIDAIKAIPPVLTAVEILQNNFDIMYAQMLKLQGVAVNV